MDRLIHPWNTRDMLGFSGLMGCFGFYLHQDYGSGCGLLGHF